MTIEIDLDKCTGCGKCANLCRRKGTCGFPSGAECADLPSKGFAT